MIHSERNSPVSTSSWVTIVESEESKCATKYIHVHIYRLITYIQMNIKGGPRSKGQRCSTSSHIQKDNDIYSDFGPLHGNVFDFLSLDRR